MTVVTTLQDKCKACYACIRNCPVKAIRVDDGQAQVVEERCISCGSCVRVCAQKAKTIMSSSEVVELMLRESKEPVIAMLAPSFLVSFPRLTPGQIVAALRKAGFAQVESVTAGVDFTLPVYRDYLQNHQGTVISTFCPAVVGLVEKHFPQLVHQLAPIHSAAAALAKDIKYRNPHSKVVFLGPCVAKKEEARRYPELIDAVLTFRELKELFDLKGILPATENPEGEDFTQCLAQIFPVSGGLLRNLQLEGEDFLLENSMVEGRDDCLEILTSLQAGKIKPRFLDILFCRGCIDGPEVDSPLDFHARKKKMLSHKRLANPGQPRKTSVELGCTFEDRSRCYPQPSEEEITKVLQLTYKSNPEDELNCGACGYNTCREKAVAVLQGLAEPDMCLPYLLHASRGEIEYYKTRLRGINGPKYSMDTLVGQSGAMTEAKMLIADASYSDTPLLFTGEQGVGKKYLAVAVHNLSHRRYGPFSSINCSELPEMLLEVELFGCEEGNFAGLRQEKRKGRLEQSEGGTLLLENIDQLPINIQARIVRAMENKEFLRVGGTHPIKMDVRIFSSTTKDLKKLVLEGVFRKDLLTKLNITILQLPPLQERKEDIPQLVDSIIEKIAREKHLTPKIVSQNALNHLMNYNWPGNVAELEQVLERGLYLADGNIIRSEHLPAGLQNLKQKQSVGKVRPLKEAIRDLEKELILEALEATGNNKLNAANLLGIPRATLYQRLKEFDLV